MPLRNRVAHAGVRVSRREAELSIAAAEAIERFAAERLEERWATYPRTAVLAIGHDRLRKRWGDSPVDKFFEQTSGEPFYAIAFASWVSGDGQGQQAS
jgi:ribosomal protein S12 methylthiotransferase accessory factor YcaO